MNIHDPQNLEESSRLAVDFDWAELLRRFGEPGDEPVGREQAEQFAAVLRRLLLFIHGGCRLKPGIDRALGRRALMVIWATLPHTLNGVSIRELARILDASAPKLADISGQFSREFGVRSHGQSHAANWKGGTDERS